VAGAFANWVARGVCNRFELSARAEISRPAAGETVSDATALEARETRMSRNLFPPTAQKNLETAGIKRTLARSEWVVISPLEGNLGDRIGALTAAPNVDPEHRRLAGAGSQVD
jgi:hypothetical protein